MELNELFNRLNRASNPSDYLSRQGFGSRWTRTSGSNLLRDQGYGNQLVNPTYGSIPQPSAPSRGLGSVGSAGISPNFNRAWGGDMDFPTLGVIADQAMAMGSRAQKRASARAGGYSGRGRGQGQGQGQGQGPQGGGVLGVPQGAPSPMRAPRTPTSRTRKQKRQDAALINRLQTAYPDDFSAGPDFSTVSPATKEQWEASEKFEKLDKKLAEEAQGSHIPVPPSVRTDRGADFQPTEQQLAQADIDAATQLPIKQDPMGNLSYEELVKRAETLEEDPKRARKKAEMEAKLRKNRTPAVARPKPAWMETAESRDPNAPPPGAPDLRRTSQRPQPIQLVPASESAAYSSPEPATPSRPTPAWMEAAEPRDPNAPPPGAPDLSWRQQQQTQQSSSRSSTRSSRRRTAGPSSNAMNQIRSDIQQASKEAQARNAENM